MKKLYVERDGQGEWGPDAIREFRKATGCKRRGLSVALSEKIAENLYQIQIGYSRQGAVTVFPAVLVHVCATKREEAIRNHGSYCPSCGWLSTHHFICSYCQVPMKPQVGNWQKRIKKGAGNASDR